MIRLTTLSVLMAFIVSAVLCAQTKRTRTFLNSYYGPPCSTAIDRYYLGMESNEIEGKDYRVWEEGSLPMFCDVYRGEEKCTTMDTLSYFSQDGYITKIQMLWCDNTFIPYTGERKSQDKVLAYVKRLGREVQDILVAVYKKPQVSRVNVDLLSVDALWGMLDQEMGEVELARWKMKEFSISLKVRIQRIVVYTAPVVEFAGIVEFELNDTTSMPQKVVQWFSDSLKRDPNNPTYYYRRGLAYTQQQKYDKAIEDLNKSIALNSSYADPYFTRAYCQQSSGSSRKAIDDYSHYLNLKPESALCVYTRGQLQYDLKNYEAAITDYKKAFDLKFDKSRCLINIGWAYTIAGKYDSAIITNREILNRDDYDAMCYARYNNGITYLYMNDSVKADSVYSAIYKIGWDKNCKEVEEIGGNDIVEGVATSRIQEGLGRSFLQRYFNLTEAEITQQLQEVRSQQH